MTVLTIGGAIVLLVLVLFLLPVVLLLGATMLLFGLLLAAATFVGWALWASWAVTAADLHQYAMAGAVVLGVVGLLAVRARDRLARR
jgi:hypothetical protein